MEAKAKFKCPHCGVELAIQTPTEPQRVRCGGCSKTFNVQPPGYHPPAPPDKPPWRLAIYHCRVCRDMVNSDFARFKKPDGSCLCPDHAAWTYRYRDWLPKFSKLWTVPRWLPNAFAFCRKRPGIVVACLILCVAVTFPFLDRNGEHPADEPSSQHPAGGLSAPWATKRLQAAGHILTTDKIIGGVRCIAFRVPTDGPAMTTELLCTDNLNSIDMISVYVTGPADIARSEAVTLSSQLCFLRLADLVPSVMEVIDVVTRDLHPVVDSGIPRVEGRATTQDGWELTTIRYTAAHPNRADNIFYRCDLVYTGNDLDWRLEFLKAGFQQLSENYPETQDQIQTLTIQAVNSLKGEGYDVVPINVMIGLNRIAVFSQQELRFTDTLLDYCQSRRDGNDHDTTIERLQAKYAR